METDKHRNEFILYAASKYIWWKDANISPPNRIIARVMNIGTWDDIFRLCSLFSDVKIISSNLC